MRVALALATVLLLIDPTRAARAGAEVQLRISSGPYYVGVPVEIQVHASGFERSPDPQCDGRAPPNGALALVGIVPNVSTSMQIIGGRVTRSESVTFVCQWRFTASAAGHYELPPFTVTQGSIEVRTPLHEIEVADVPMASEIRIRVEVPETPVYVGQRVPIRIEWWLDESLQERISGYQLQSEIFDREDLFRFVDDAAPARGDQTLDLTTAAGPLSLRAEVERRQDGDKSFLVVSAERTLIPLRDGSLDLTPATVRVEEVVRWRRDLFGGRRPAATRSILSRDRARRLVVRPAPAAGRPASYAGAIGRGFSLDVAADRSVVQVGDPITLTLTVRGDGNLDAVGLPDWGSAEGLSPDRLRLSEGDLSGEVHGDSKVFRLSVRVLDDGVRQIPALPFSWFDPELGEYQTALSRPIAVSVKPAQVIDASDVEAARAPDAQPEEAEGGVQPITASERRGRLGLSGADLSIERDPERLTRHTGGGTTLRAVAYAGSLALLSLTVLVSRRGRVPAEVTRLRGLVRDVRARLAGATGHPPHEALAVISAALRELAAALPGPRDGTLDDFVRGCDEILYSPDTSRAGVELAARLARAQQLVDQVSERIA